MEEKTKTLLKRPKNTEKTEAYNGVTFQEKTQDFLHKSTVAELYVVKKRPLYL